MARSKSQLKPLPVAIAWNLVGWSVMVPALMILLDPIFDTPLPDAEGWKRIAMFGLPIILVGAVIHGLAERSVSRLTRSFGHGFAVALVFFVFNAADHLRTEVDMLRLLKGLLIVPIVAMFLAAPQWMRDEYLTPPESQ